MLGIVSLYLLSTRQIMIMWLSLQIIKQGLSLFTLDCSLSTNKNKMTILLVYTTIICKEEIYRLSFFTGKDIDLHCQSFPLILSYSVKMRGLRWGSSFKGRMNTGYKNWWLKKQSLKFKPRISPTVSMPQISSKSSSTTQPVCGLDLFLIPRDVLNYRR